MCGPQTSTINWQLWVLLKVALRFVPCFVLHTVWQTHFTKQSPWETSGTLSYTNSPPCKVPEGSSPCSQELATDPYPEPYEFSPQPENLFPEDLFNIILTSTPRSSEWSLLFTFWSENFIGVLLRLHAPYIRLPFHHHRVTFVNMLVFRVRSCWYPPNLQVEDHPLSIVCDCLLNKFAATLHIWKPRLAAITWARAIQWWQSTEHTVCLLVCFD
jgi:hypothetical protein